MKISQCNNEPYVRQIQGQELTLHDPIIAGYLFDVAIRRCGQCLLNATCKPQLVLHPGGFTIINSQIKFTNDNQRTADPAS